MKLDVSSLRYMTRDDFRVLTAVEMGMKNHALVPVDLIIKIAGLRHGGVNKILSNLLRYKLVHHERKTYDGYNLTYGGYDYLALKAFVQRGVLAGVGRKIGVGKESDIYAVVDADGNELVLKLQRLGRNRDYLKDRKNASWLYLSRIASLKEFTFMKALHGAGFPTPTPIDWNRHAIVMSMAPGYTLASVHTVGALDSLYDTLMGLVVRMARVGLIHCDFNEYNLMVDDDQKTTLIDFPQMVSTSHANAEMYFDRDVQCVRKFFARKFGYHRDDWPTLASIGDRTAALDVEVSASGFEQEVVELEAHFEAMRMDNAEAGEGEEGRREGGEDDEDEDGLDAGEGSEKAAPDADADGPVSLLGYGLEDQDDDEMVHDGAAEAAGGGDKPIAAAAAPTKGDAEGADGSGEDGEEDEEAGGTEESSDDGEIMAASEPIMRLRRTGRGGSRRPTRGAASSGDTRQIRERAHREVASRRRGTERGNRARNVVKSKDKRKIAQHIHSER